MGITRKGRYKVKTSEDGTVISEHNEQFEAVEAAVSSGLDTVFIEPPTGWEVDNKAMFGWNLQTGSSSPAAPPAEVIETADYYVAPTTATPAGSDSNPGTLAAPFATFDKADSVVSAGQLVYFRGGTYTVATGQINIDSDGTSGNLIRYWAYPGESPVFDGSTKSTGDEMLRFRGSWNHFKGLRFTNSGEDNKATRQCDGVVMTANEVGGCTDNIIEECEFDNNQGVGLAVRGSDNNDGRNANILVLNCDFHDNWDDFNSGENGDGIAFGNGVGTGCKLVGCRSWSNSDDGIDAWEAGNSILIADCWSFDNGKDTSGDGNAFKLGQDLVGVNNENHVIRDCIAAENSGNGFTQNNNDQAMDIDNCTSYSNNWNWWFGDAAGSHTLDASISHSGSNSDNFTRVTDTKNSWNNPPNPTVTDADFETVTGGVAQMSAARQSDGGLPALTYLKLVSGSDMRGTDIGGTGVHYLGTREFNGGTTTNY